MPQLSESAPLLVLNPEKCNGCRSCESACSLRNARLCDPAKSRIHVVKRDLGISVPIMCLHCEEPICQAVCPTGAIHREPQTNAILIDEKKCMGCKFCIYACPFGSVSFDTTTYAIIKCSLCDGDPVCARFCPTGALEFIRVDKLGAVQARAKAQRWLEALARGGR